MCSLYRRNCKDGVNILVHIIWVLWIYCSSDLRILEFFYPRFKVLLLKIWIWQLKLTYKLKKIKERKLLQTNCKRNFSLYFSLSEGGAYEKPYSNKTNNDITTIFLYIFNHLIF